MSQISTFSFEANQENSKFDATPAQLSIMESLETLWIARAIASVE